MKWYSGTIPSAIQEAKSKSAIFVVYISGFDDTSKKMDETWNNAAVADECEREGMVVIKVDAQSETCTQFSAIYPVVCVPSVFFIGNDGIPLEITGGFKSPEEFEQILQRISQTHKSGPPPTTVPEVASSHSLRASASCDTPPQTTPATSEPQPSTSASVTSASREEKIRKAQEVIEQKRIAKAEEEKEKERQQEIDRRKLGKEVKKLDDWKEERKVKETQDQLKKDREEDKKARERVREQIARDRADRAAKYQKDKEEKERAQQAKEKEKLAAKQEALAKEMARKSEQARVQFRLADGSFVTHEFSSSDSLETARQFIAQHMGRTSASISLSTTYPRRTFNEGDMSQTLADLGLTPSAVIMVLPGSTRSVSSPSTSVSDQGFLQLLLAPFLYIWAIICSIFMGSSQPNARPVQAAGEPQPEPTARESTSRDSNTGSAHQRKSQSPKTFHQEGNIHRLTDTQRNPDEDDMGMWNGNSTQQM